MPMQETAPVAPAAGKANPLGDFTPETFEAALSPGACARLVDRAQALGLCPLLRPRPAETDGRSLALQQRGRTHPGGFGPAAGKAPASAAREVFSPSPPWNLPTTGWSAPPPSRPSLRPRASSSRPWMRPCAAIPTCSRPISWPSRRGSARKNSPPSTPPTSGTAPSSSFPRGVVLPRPILVSHAASGGAVFPHTLVVAEEEARVTVIDLFTSSGGRPQLACGANDLYAGHGSHLTYIAVQDWSQSTLSFQLNSTVVRRDARVQSLNIHLGGRQSRHESLSQLQAPGAFSEMLALTVAGGAQEFDQRTLQVHQAPNTKSDLLYKNVLLESSRTIFSGLIIVDPDAQKTDAYQANRNLVLSDAAEANSLPGLEIQANDVRCTHGATTSRIDPEQEFYLLSRGLTRSAAQRLLIFGFFEEVLNRLESGEIHSALRHLIEGKISGAQAG